MYSIRQAADLLDMPAKVIRQLAHDGELTGAVRVASKGGESWRLPPEAVELLRSRKPATPAQARPGVDPAQDYLVPMSVVIDLLQGEADGRRQAQRFADDQSATVAMLRDTLDQERDEILRLRCEIVELRQQLQEAQSGLFRVHRKPLATVDHDRPTQPLDMEILRQIAAQNYP